MPRSPATHLRRDDPVKVVNPFTLYNPVPSRDPWYRPPPGWESKPPGAVLSVREHAYKGPRGFPGYFDVVQVLYRTTDSHGRPNYAATVAFMPDSHRRCAETFRNASNPVNCSNALVSYNLPYDSSSPDAAVTYTMQFGEPYGEIEVMLKRGYFVSVPDYEGSRASYGANVLAGYTILDQFRALQATLGNYGFRTNGSKLAMWGYSSGGTATEFAAELAAEYAPDLKLAGAIAGGMTGNMTESLDLVNMHDVAGLLVQGIIGLTGEYPEQRRWVDSKLRKHGPNNSSEFYKAANMFGLDGLGYFAYQNIYDYFENGYDDVFAPTMLGPMKAEGLAGIHGTPNMPVLIYQSVHDEMCPIKFLDTMVKGHCEKGGNIWIQRNAMGNHNYEGVNGRQRALDFLRDVIEGTKTSGRPEKGCRSDDGVWDYNGKDLFS